MTRPGYKMTEIGEIPQKWEYIKIGDTKVVEKMKAGGTPLKSVKEYYENGMIPFVKIEDMVNSSKYLATTQEFITEDGLNHSSSWLTPIDSILFSMYASYGEVSINKIPVATNQAIISIVPKKENVDVTFLYYELKNLKSSLKQYLRSTTQSNLNAEIVRGLKIVLPPLPEQQKIAEILTTADQNIELINQEIQAAEKLKKGLMQTLLTKGIWHTKYKKTEIGEIPEEWSISNFGTSFIKNNIKVGKIKESQIKSIGKFPVVDQSKRIISGYTDNEDLVYSGEMPLILFGDHTLVFKYIDFKFVAGADGTKLLIPNKNIFYPKFLFYVLLSRNIKSEGYKRHYSKLKMIAFQIPPILEQQKIAEILSTADNKIELLKNKKERLEKLKKGLMNDLLTGQVRVKIDSSRGEN